MLIRVGHQSQAVANYLLALSKRDGRPVTPMQLLKLVFISHGWMLGLHGRPLCSEGTEAWRYGPVIPSLYHAYKEYGSGHIGYVGSADADEFDAEEKLVLEQVWGHYSKFTGIQLSTLTHRPKSPWDETVRMSGYGTGISNDLMAEYYRRLATQG